MAQLLVNQTLFIVRTISHKIDPTTRQRAQVETSSTLDKDTTSVINDLSPVTVMCPQPQCGQRHVETEFRTFRLDKRVGRCVLRIDRDLCPICAVIEQVHIATQHGDRADIIAAEVIQNQMNSVVDVVDFVQTRTEQLS